MKSKNIHALPGLGIVAVLIGGLTGCEQNEVAVYDIPKEPSVAQNAHAATPSGDPHAGVAMGKPSLTWGDLPETWSQANQPSSMRLASFSITGDAGESAEFAIIPMGGFAGSDAQLVNMWRMPLGLGEVEEGEAAQQAVPVSIGDDKGRLYEMAGTTEAGDTRLIVASLNRDGVSYFFKMTGSDALVAAQKDALLEFLAGVTFSTESLPVSAPHSSPSMATASGTLWETPADWEELPATQFLLAKYRLSATDGATADVTLSKLSGSGGGVLPNVNRWRGQLNLAPVDEAGLEAVTSEFATAEGSSILVELEGTDLRSGEPGKMLVVIVSTATESWYFKLTGAPSAVEAKRGEFLSFVEGTHL